MLLELNGDKTYQKNLENNKDAVNINMLNIVKSIINENGVRREEDYKRFLTMFKKMLLYRRTRD